MPARESTRSSRAPKPPSRRWCPWRRRQSDDRGEFRLTGLAAGQYYVSVFDPAFAGVGDETGPLRYTPTYYPGVAVVEQAARVAVTPGVEPPPITFKLKIIRPSRVSGVIGAEDRRPLLSGAVIMAPIRGEWLNAVPTQDVVILPDGSFAFRNVPPGSYQIRARGEVESGGASLFATYKVLVDGRDIASVELVLQPGASAAGRLTVEAVRSAKPPGLGGLRVRAPFTDGSSFGDTLTGEVLADGSFAIRGLMAGTHILTVEGCRIRGSLKASPIAGRTSPTAASTSAAGSSDSTTCGSRSPTSRASCRASCATRPARPSPTRRCSSCRCRISSGRGPAGGSACSAPTRAAGIACAACRPASTARSPRSRWMKAKRIVPAC